MEWFTKERLEAIGRFAIRLCECGHLGAQLFDEVVKKAAEKEAEVTDSDILLNYKTEFIYFLLYTADCRLMSFSEDEHRLYTMDRLLTLCIDRVVKEHLVYLPAADWGPVIQEYVDQYSTRAVEYADCDLKRQQDATSPRSNYIEWFGRVLCRIVGTEDFLLLLSAAGLAKDVTSGCEQFEGIQLDEFEESMR